MTNPEVREWYKQQVDRIPSMNEVWVSEGIGVEERAKRAWLMRHEARLLARQMMEDPRQVEELRNRDLEKYGNRDGPSFEYVVRQATELGLKGDKIYAAIIEGSFITNADVNRRFKIE